MRFEGFLKANNLIRSVALYAAALVDYHQADFAVMADEDFMKWLFEKTK